MATVTVTVWPLAADSVTGKVRSVVPPVPSVTDLSPIDRSGAASLSVTARLAGLSLVNFLAPSTG